MADDDALTVYTLHYFPFSLYSLMTRFAFTLGQSLNPETAPNLDLRLVNLQQDENLTEPYLTRVSQKGQVPVLTSPALPSSIDDSYDISQWLCQKQPELLPDEHREVIDLLLRRLYNFHALPLSISQDDRRDGIPNQAAAMLEDPELTERHRRALEIKSVFHDSQHSRTVEPDNILQVEEQSRRFIRDLDSLLQEHLSSADNADEGNKPWIFGDIPTILDAHAATLAVRLIDLKRFDLLSETVQTYARAVMETDEWKQVTHGRPTIWDEKLGPVEALNPL